MERKWAVICTGTPPAYVGVAIAPGFAHPGINCDPVDGPELKGFGRTKCAPHTKIVFTRWLEDHADDVQFLWVFNRLSELSADMALALDNSGKVPAPYTAPDCDRLQHWPNGGIGEGDTGGETLINIST